MCTSAKAIDEYASLKTKAAEAKDESTVIDPRLEAIVEKMLDKYVKLHLHVTENGCGFNHFLLCCLTLFYRCIADGKYQQAIGMGIECRRLDKLEEAVIRSDNIHATINYCIDVSHNFVYRREYRLEVNSLRPFYFVSC